MNQLKNSYPKSMRVFHILGIVFVFLAFGFIFTREFLGSGDSLRYIWLQGHFIVGLLVLLFVILRSINRLMNYRKIPPIVPPLTSFNQTLAHVAHMMLYLWMIIMPLLGWALVSASYGDITAFGIYIPEIIEENRETARLLRQLHEIGAVLGLVLIGGHAMMALLHHFKIGDTTLVRMFPWFHQRKKNK